MTVGRVVALAVGLALAAPSSAQDLGGALDLGQLGASMPVNNAIMIESRARMRAQAGGGRARVVARGPTGRPVARNVSFA